VALTTFLSRLARLCTDKNYLVNLRCILFFMSHVSRKCVGSKKNPGTGMKEHCKHASQENNRTWNQTATDKVVIASMQVKRTRGQGTEQLLIQWSNMPMEDATWEGVNSLKTRSLN
jgi:hypothetical protein